MITIPELPLPTLVRNRFASVYAYTDEELFDARALRIAFTERTGGLSEGAFASLNLGINTDDACENTQGNRDVLMRALGAFHAPCLTPRQVHGKTLCRIREDDERPLDTLAAMNAEGVDALLIEASQVAALLCFADCVPIIMVSPTGRFTVVHAGWRGVMNRIAAQAFTELRACDADAQITLEPDCYNVYIGPYIHGECFEVSTEIHDDFVRGFGAVCAFDETHIDLGRALRLTFAELGVAEARIADVEKCTVCEHESFFSYRMSEGLCGRHGAFAIRM